MWDDRDTVPPARGAYTHAYRRYTADISKSLAIFWRQQKIAALAMCRRSTADVQAYLHHGPEAPCHDHAINTGAGTYELRTCPLISTLLLRLHGWASGPRPKSLA